MSFSHKLHIIIDSRTLTNCTLNINDVAQQQSKQDSVGEDNDKCTKKNPIILKNIVPSIF